MLEPPDFAWKQIQIVPTDDDDEYDNNDDDDYDDDGDDDDEDYNCNLSISKPGPLDFAWQQI